MARTWFYWFRWYLVNRTIIQMTTGFESGLKGHGSLCLLQAIVFTAHWLSDNSFSKQLICSVGAKIPCLSMCYQVTPYLSYWNATIIQKFNGKHCLFWLQFSNWKVLMIKMYVKVCSSSFADLVYWYCRNTLMPRQNGPRFHTAFTPPYFCIKLLCFIQSYIHIFLREQIT